VYLTVFITKPSPGSLVWPPRPLRAIAWCHSSHGVILDESLSAHIKDPAPVEPSDYRRAGERGSAVTKRTSPTSALSNWPASPFIAGALAIIIFVIDTFTPLNIAIAVLYVIVVLMAANFFRRRGVILVSLACAGLTVLSFILQHDWDTSDSIGRNLVSLTAIGVTAILALNRQRAEDAWRRSETYLTEAQRLSRTGSFSWKIATEEQVWSEEIFRIFEYDFATKPTLDLVRRRSHPDDASMLEQAFEQALSGAQSIDITHRLLMPDGSVKHVKVLAHPAQDVEKNNVEYIGVLMDITAAKQAEEALQELQASLAHVTRVTALGELTASIAHEVNQPLAAIVTYGDAGLRWLDREVPQLDEVRSAVERMIDCAMLAGEVIARLRALSRKTAPEMVRLDINEVVNEVLSLIRREISNHQVSVRLDLAASLPPIFGDRVQLQQVILNLLVNGIQAIALVRDRPRELLIRSQADNTAQILVEVGDSGIGIDPAHAGLLFNAFFTTKADGMGMGLSICRSIIEAHGGRIWASPNAGPGTTFQFTLPAHRADAVQPEGTAWHAPA
jgi:signal transduction histidine kinase